MLSRKKQYIISIITQINKNIEILNNNIFWY